ncbi:dermonecrotic toxin domain-containing protein [Pseudomonas sp. DSP3-2-2]|uniref:dermonecrotic toxin domain-containing protein n=1 Tax=unclassified Pseudomonas TaxID=196821 RepID=UPI003CFA95C7
MQTPNQNFRQSTVANRHATDQERLKSIARAFIKDYPDIHGLAYAEARKLLFRHTGKWLNPESVYWHRFASAATSLATFTGWRHLGPPIESMTFVELMLHRFNVHDQLVADELQLYGGFYTDGPTHEEFDERNEVALLPRQILDDFWALDFSAMFMARIERFWTLHSGNFRTLARSGLLAAAALQLRKGGLTVEQFKVINQAVMGELRPVMTLEALQSDVTPDSGLTLYTFDIGGYVCPESVRIVESSGRQFVYLPGEATAFHVFASEQALYAWVQGRLGNASARAAFTALFLRSVASRQLQGAAFEQAAEQIVNIPWVAGQSLINHQDVAIRGDIFVYLRAIARQQMQDDAQTLLTSNASLRKQIWIGYLNAFLNVFGALGPLGWPMALTLVGAGIANLGLNTDQAINSRDARQRKAGLIGAVFNAVFVVFNLPILLGLLRAGDTGLAAVSSVETANASGSGELVPMVDLAPRPQPVVEGEVLDEVVNEVTTGQLLTVRSSFWDRYMSFDLEEELRVSRIGLARQAAVMNVPELSADDLIMRDTQGTRFFVDEWGDAHHVFRKADGTYVGGRIPLYTTRDSSFNQYLRSGVSQGVSQVELIDELADDLQTVGLDNSVTLYRGGSDLRGTSGRYFRSGQIRAGDVLVTTDITSFSENPYIARAFCSSQAGDHSATFAGTGAAVGFSGSSVVFELPARNYLGASPVAAFSNEPEEVESIFMPGRYFLIDGIQEVSGLNYKFIKVCLTEVPEPKSWHRLYDLRTGEAFTRTRFAAKLGEEGKPLVDRFFPVNLRGLRD